MLNLFQHHIDIYVPYTWAACQWNRETSSGWCLVYF